MKQERQDCRCSDIDAICDLKAKYFRLMDQKQWAAFTELFTEDATFDVRGATDPPCPESELEKLPIIEGRSAFVEYASSGLAEVISVHHGMMPEIELIDDNEARGIWAMRDLLLFPEGSAPGRIEGYGHYFERYVRNREGWKIAELKLRRLHVDFQP